MITVEGVSAPVAESVKVEATSAADAVAAAVEAFRLDGKVAGTVEFVGEDSTGVWEVAMTIYRGVRTTLPALREAARTRAAYAERHGPSW
jgi:hypothetical protein